MKKIFGILALLLVIIALLLASASRLRRGHTSVQLLDAAEAGDMLAVRRLLVQGTPINATSSRKFGWTPLIGAIFHNQTNMVRLLVESGADVNLPDRNGETPLMWAIGHGDEAAAIVSYLLHHGADLTATNKDGVGAFDCARSSPSKPKIIEILEAARQAERIPHTTHPNGFSGGKKANRIEDAK